MGIDGSHLPHAHLCGIFLHFSGERKGFVLLCEITEVNKGTTRVKGGKHRRKFLGRGCIIAALLRKVKTSMAFFLVPVHVDSEIARGSRRERSLFCHYMQ